MPPSTTLISAPRKLNAQLTDRRSKPNQPPIPVSKNKRGLPEDCTSNVDHTRQRTDSMSSTKTVSASQSRIQSLISTHLRRHSTDEPQASQATQAQSRARTTSAKSAAIEFPKAAAQSSIPVRSPSVTSARKRLLSKNDEDEVQPRVRPRLHSSTSVETLRGVAAIKSTRSSMDETRSTPERKRSGTVRYSISGAIDPGRGEPAKAVTSTDVVADSKPALKRKPTFQTLLENRVRKPVVKTNSAATAIEATSALSSAVDTLFAQEGSNLVCESGDMSVDDLEEIPDLPAVNTPCKTLRSPPRVFKPELDRFDVKIVSDKHTEVWDTIETAVYAWEGVIHVTDKNSKAVWANSPLVDTITIECRAKETPTSPHASGSPALEDYSTEYQGQSLHEDEVLRSMDYTQGITVNKQWDRDFSYQHPNVVHWKLKFWVPIPMELFAKVEDRQFKLRAKLVFRDPSASVSKISAHSGSVDMSISSLKTSMFVSL